jgi:hypothetical protein
MITLYQGSSSHGLYLVGFLGERRY